MISKKLFGRKYSLGEWIITLTGLCAAGITITQNILTKGFLTIGIEENITKTPPNQWMLLLGIILLVIVIMYIKKTK